MRSRVDDGEKFPGEIIIVTDRSRENPMRIKLSEERRADLTAAIRRLFAAEFDREISDFQVARLIDFFVRHLGAPVYNQAVQDARAFLAERLEDLDGELYEPEEPT